MKDQLHRFNLINRITAEANTHKLAKRLKCDYPFIGRELNKLSTKKLERLAEAKTYKERYLQ